MKLILTLILLCGLSTPSWAEPSWKWGLTLGLSGLSTVCSSIVGAYYSDQTVSSSLLFFGFNWLRWQSCSQSPEDTQISHSDV